MAEINKILMKEFCDLKLELNAAQQAKTSLELELDKKDKMLLKIHADSIEKELQYQQEIESLEEQLKETPSSNEKNSINAREEVLKQFKARESQGVRELRDSYREIIKGYCEIIATCNANSQELEKENDKVKKHIANLELSYSDLHQKFEEAKTIVYGFQNNEEKLKKKFAILEETVHKQKEKYESLKYHTEVQLEKSNKEMIKYMDEYDVEVNKLDVIIKRLEIRSIKLEKSLDHKSQECIALHALFDELTRKKV